MPLPTQRYCDPTSLVLIYYIRCNLISPIIVTAGFNHSANVLLITLEQHRGSQLIQVTDPSTTPPRLQLYMCSFLWACGDTNNQDNDDTLTHSANWYIRQKRERERERERERDRERQRETERDRERQRERQRETDRQTDRHRESQTLLSLFINSLRQTNIRRIIASQRRKRILTHRNTLFVPDLNQNF